MGKGKPETADQFWKSIDIDFIRGVRGMNWVVYTKPPFRGPQQVFGYL